MNRGHVCPAAAAVAFVLLIGCPFAPAQVPAPPPGEEWAVRTGPEDAPRQLTLYCNFESPACSRLTVVLRRVLSEQPERVAVTFRHVASEGQQRSRSAYSLALAASRQGKGWEVLDHLLRNVGALDSIGLESLEGPFALDLARLAADCLAAEAAAALAADGEEAERMGVTAVPALFVDGRRLPDVFTYEALVAALR
jgi:protein-disulfide isomerase